MYIHASMMYSSIHNYNHLIIHPFIMNSMIHVCPSLHNTYTHLSHPSFNQLVSPLADIPQDTTPSPSSTGTFSPTNVCEICCENPRNTALTCGHQFCTDCSKKVDNCPICRKFIQHRIMLFQ